MKKYSAVLITIILALSFISVTAVAQPFGAGTPGAGKAFNGPARGGMHGGQAPMRGLMGLDLTDTQRDDIARIMDEYQAARLADCEVTRDEMIAKRAELDALMNEYPYDKKEARRILGEKFQINIEKQVLRQELHNRILHEVLTDEQREALENQRANAAAFGRGFRAGAGAGTMGGMSRGGGRLF